ncbi:MAG: hypothetical protein JW816_00895 [Candidatus Buchananbacteria bacterium]|nr:hypothetical protein [Candidatus Buchananbacteria bacterium]
MAYQFSKPKNTKEAVKPVAPTQKATNDSARSNLRGLITLIVIIIIVAGGIYFLNRYTGNGLLGGSSQKADYQAVFLDNGQVYFGKITKMADDYINLRDIYYLQAVDQPLQTSQQGDTTTTANQQTQQQLKLIKLGNEIHGPKDEMSINRSHVVIIEDLKDDSQVVKAIKNYLSGEKNSQQQVQQPTPSQPVQQPQEVQPPVETTDTNQ